MASKLYKHWRDVPKGVWRWPNFRPQEIACKGSGELLLDEDALDKLQALRRALGRPVVINSGYRSERHNAAVGGSPTSQHRLAAAFDIALRGPRVARDIEREELIREALEVGFTGIGRYDNFVHVDTGPARTWDHRTKKES